ncbi:hypothetical protein LCGC14_1439930 [marine sediment metagenome]|uniref:Uncharacterized protein n=1 Tax=marine sediment metagenome TaxID=412755 RepID=A0A0F9JLJ0_9ZZZZ
MAKKKTQVKMIEERKKRRAQLIEARQRKIKLQEEMEKLVALEFRIIGAIEQLDELEDG